MSFIWMLKRAGDRMLPCGTPISCSCSSDNVEPTLTLKCRWDENLSISSVQSLDRLDRRRDMRNDSAEIFFQSFLQEALVSSSGMGRGVHSLTLSIQHFPPSKARWRMVLERLLWRVTCPNHASFRLLTAARRGSCGPTRELIMLRIQSLVLCS